MFNWRLCAHMVVGITLCWSPAAVLAQDDEAVEQEAEEIFNPRFEVSPAPVALNADDPTMMNIGSLHYRGGLVLSGNSPHFGGFSGLVVSPGGEQILAVTDRGYWFHADVIERNGRIAGLANTQISPLLDWRGRELVGGENDAEAMEMLPGGQGILVAFEGWDRLWRYRSEMTQSYQSIFGIIAQPVQVPRALETLPDNGGIEAMAWLDEDRLLLLAERGEDENGTHQGWIWDQRRAQPFGYLIEDGFHPTDMTMLPGGDFLVLLRSFSALSGLTIKLEMLSAADIVEGAMLQGREIARFKPPLTIDNMEGLAAREDEDGKTILYLISDNNFNSLQRTLLMVFELTEE